MAPGTYIQQYYNLPLITKKLLAHYIINRKYNITFRQITSRTFQSEAEVQQGSALSPTLFILYTNDIPNSQNMKLIILKYADDITIFTNSTTRPHLRQHIQTELIHFDNYQS